MRLEDRVKRLERENRRLKAAGLVSVLVVGLVFLMGQAAEVPEEIKARKFSLVDASGVSRAVLGIGADGPELALFDQIGDVRFAHTEPSRRLAQTLSLLNIDPPEDSTGYGRPLEQPEWLAVAPEIRFHQGVQPCSGSTSCSPRTSSSRIPS